MNCLFLNLPSSTPGTHPPGQKQRAVSNVNEVANYNEIQKLCK